MFTLSLFVVSSLSNALFVAAPTAISGSLSVLDTASFSNPVFMASNLTVMGHTSLSNSLCVYGTASFYNTQLCISGPTSMDGTLVVSGATELSNSVSVYGSLSSSNNSYFSSNVYILGSLNVEKVNYNYNNIVIYNSEQIQSNLSVQGTFQVNGDTSISNILVQGCSVLSNVVSVYSPMTMYEHISTMTMSNADGKAVLSASTSNFGINIEQGSNANFTLDVNGNINFTGGIYKNGAVFNGSGWDSLFITSPGMISLSNAAGEVRFDSGSNNLSLTGTDSLLLTSPGMMSLSNAAGEVRFDSGSNTLSLVGMNSLILTSPYISFIGSSYAPCLFVQSNLYIHDPLSSDWLELHPKSVWILRHTSNTTVAPVDAHTWIPIDSIVTIDSNSFINIPSDGTYAIDVSWVDDTHLANDTYQYMFARHSHWNGVDTLTATGKVGYETNIVNCRQGDTIQLINNDTYAPIMFPETVCTIVKL